MARTATHRFEVVGKAARSGMQRTDALPCTRRGMVMRWRPSRLLAVSMTLPF